jgi:putative DNA primase/helicase
MIPAPFRTWLVDAANRVKLLLEMLAAPAVVAAGGLVGRTVGIRPNRYDEFTVVPNLWGALIARPGWMKTGAYSEPYRPIN